MKSITLHAFDLLSKWGFGDGDIIDDLRIELDSDLDVYRSDDLLCELVERYLKPLLPPDVVLYRICSIHNPIRAHYEDDGYAAMLEKLGSISVDVTVEQVLTVAEELQARYARDEG